ncbi:hypothetical protein ACOJQI_20425 [Bacillus salacetis]|uniref:hypothetical protein n=1 Tax=Bacillus salacetis TaxID=2315464 RepID=UPI003BA34D65
MSKKLLLTSILVTICLSVWLSVFVLYFIKGKNAEGNEAIMPAVKVEKVKEAVRQEALEDTHLEKIKEETASVNTEIKDEKEVETTKEVEEKSAYEPSKTPAVPKEQVPEAADPQPKKGEEETEVLRLYESYFPDFYAWWDNVSATDVRPPLLEDYHLDKYYSEYVSEHFDEMKGKVFSFNTAFKYLGEELPTNGTFVQADVNQLQQKADMITEYAMEGISEPYTHWLTLELGETYSEYLQLVERYMYDIRIRIDDDMFDPVIIYASTEEQREVIQEQSVKVGKLLEKVESRMLQEEQRMKRDLILLNE